MPDNTAKTIATIGNDKDGILIVELTQTRIIQEKTRGKPNGLTTVIVEMRLISSSRNPNEHAPNVDYVDAYLRYQDEINQLAGVSYSLVERTFPSAIIFGPCWQDNNELHFSVKASQGK